MAHLLQGADNALLIIWVCLGKYVGALNHLAYRFISNFGQFPSCYQARDLHSDEICQVLRN